MFPSSALHVVENSSSRLVVVNPPSYGIGSLFLIIGLLILYATLSAPKVLAWPRRLILVAIFALPFLLVALAQLGSGSTLVLDRDSNTATVRTRVMAYPLHTTVLSLADVRQAIVEAGRGTRRLSLQTRNGSIVPLGLGHSTQAGQFEMAAAINQFLRKPSQP